MTTIRCCASRSTSRERSDPYDFGFGRRASAVLAQSEAMSGAASPLPIAVLGATSAIARDLIRCGAARGDAFALFARRPEAVSAFLAEAALPPTWSRGDLSDFSASPAGAFKAVLNFVGVGDPARAKSMGPLILSATLDVDRIVLAYLRRSSQTPYVFASSGAVYGPVFDRPADEATPALVKINAVTSDDYYGVAKLHAEVTHRAAVGFTILDLRIFSYVSRHLDPDGRFLINDIVRAIRSRTVLKTSRAQIWRDYIHPSDLQALFDACINAPPGTNQPIDAYSRAPIDKLSLLELARQRFGLRYAFNDSEQGVSATGAKPFYYSTNRGAATFGYTPTRSSAEAIVEEIGALVQALGSSLVQA